MEISGYILYGVMVGIGYNKVDNQIDIFLGLISITFKWRTEKPHRGVQPSKPWSRY